MTARVRAASQDRRGADRGQATVELVALLPLLALVGLAAFAVLAARAAHEQAGTAAEAGAIAILQDGDAATAARDALPLPVRSRAEIAVRGRRVVVTVRPRVPLLARLLTARVAAHAGPAPAASAGPASIALSRLEGPRQEGAEGFARRARVSRFTSRLPRVAVAAGTLPRSSGVAS